MLVLINDHINDECRQIIVEKYHPPNLELPSPAGDESGTTGLAAKMSAWGFQAIVDLKRIGAKFPQTHVQAIKVALE